MPAIRFGLLSLIAILVVLGSTGCLFAREQLNVPDFEGRVANIVPGRSTLQDLEALVGHPTSITPIADKRLLVYVFSDSKTVTFNLIVFGSSKTNVGFDTALFLVNEQDVIEQVSITENSQDLPWQFWAFGG